MAGMVVFLDYQNVYFSAREAFEDLHAPNTAGHVDPLALGERITDMARGRFDRELVQVRVYRGQQDSTKDPVGYAANMRQVSTWSKKPKVTVITRTLRYPSNWPAEKPQEKGIDVSLAVDFVVMAVRRQYDVGVLRSGDTDLKPALDAVTALGGVPYPRAEVAAWAPAARHARRLSISSAKLWCHWLDEADYRIVADTTDYGAS